VQHPRSWLTVRADDLEALTLALDTRADAVVIDLDAVAVAERRHVRTELDGWLTGVLESPPRCQLWARLSRGDSLEDDLQVLLRHDLGGVVVSRAVNAALLVELDHILGDRPIRLAAAVETAVGLLNSGALAAVSRVSHLQLDEGVLGLDLGIAPGGDGPEWASLRGHLVVVSAAFGKRPPIGSVPVTGADIEAGTRALRRAGYGGRAVADPAQVPVVNAVFAPSPEAVDAAEWLVLQAEKAGANGDVAVDDEGRLIGDVELNAAKRLLGGAR
jgi:citrate lyase subunit beta/citryl-CoA lyase